MPANQIQDIHQILEEIVSDQTTHITTIEDEANEKKVEWGSRAAKLGKNETENEAAITAVRNQVQLEEDINNYPAVTQYETIDSVVEPSASDNPPPVVSEESSAQDGGLEGSRNEVLDVVVTDIDEMLVHPNAITASVKEPAATVSEQPVTTPSSEPRIEPVTDKVEKVSFFKALWNKIKNFVAQLFGKKTSQPIEEVSNAGEGSSYSRMMNDPLKKTDGHEPQLQNTNGEAPFQAVGTDSPKFNPQVVLPSLGTPQNSVIPTIKF